MGYPLNREGTPFISRFTVLLCDGFLREAHKSQSMKMRAHAEPPRHGAAGDSALISIDGEVPKECNNERR